MVVAFVVAVAAVVAVVVVILADPDEMVVVVVVAVADVGITPLAAKIVRQMSNGYVDMVAQTPAPAPAKNAIAVGLVNN